jgi:hypothetical protein
MYNTLPPTDRILSTHPNKRPRSTLGDHAPQSSPAPVRVRMTTSESASRVESLPWPHRDGFMVQPGRDGFMGQPSQSGLRGQPGQSGLRAQPDRGGFNWAHLPPAPLSFQALGALNEFSYDPRAIPRGLSEKESKELEQGEDNPVPLLLPLDCLRWGVPVALFIKQAPTVPTEEAIAETEPPEDHSGSSAQRSEATTVDPSGSEDHSRAAPARAPSSSAQPAKLMSEETSPGLVMLAATACDLGTIVPQTRSQGQSRSPTPEL